MEPMTDPFAPLREALATYNAGGCAILKHDDTLLLARLLREHEEREAVIREWEEAKDAAMCVECQLSPGPEQWARFARLERAEDALRARSPHQEPTE